MADIVGLIISCGEIAKALVDVYETLDGAPAAIKELLTRITHLKLLLNRLQGYAQQLSPDRKEFLSDYFDTFECYKTIAKLKGLVDQTSAEKTKIHHDLKGKIKWLINKSEAEGLAAKLEKQKANILMAINMISRLNPVYRRSYCAN